MKLTLTITASAASLANILTMLDDDEGFGGISSQPVINAGEPVPAVTASPVMPEVAAAAPTVAGEPEFDTSGLAYDERIHSAKKGQTKDGKWRRKRDIADDYYNAVEAELRARYGAQVTPEVAPAYQAATVAFIPPMPENPMGNDMMPQFTPVANTVQAATVAEVAANNVQPIAPVAIQQPVQPIAPVAIQPIAPVAIQQPAQQQVTFHSVMQHVGQAMGAGTIDPDYLVKLVNEINQQLGLTMQSFTDMAAHQNAVDYCWGAFARDGKL